MGMTLDFTHGADGFFNSLGNLPGEVVSEVKDVVGEVIDTAGGALGGLLDKLGMPLMIIGGGLLVFMLIKK